MVIYKLNDEFLLTSPSTPIQSSPPILQRYRILKQVTLLSGMVSIKLLSISREVRNTTFIAFGSTFYCIPIGTHVIWGLNLRDNNVTAAYLETQAIVQAFESSAVKSAGITLDFLEIGNEADLYVHNGGRMNSWGPTQYVPQCVTQILDTEMMFNVLQLDGPPLRLTFPPPPV